MVLNACTQQNNMKLEDIKEIWVYDYFDSRGDRIGHLFRKFQELENDSIAKFRLPPLFVDSLKSMLIYSAKAKKRSVLDDKCGGDIIFAQFVMKDGSTRNIIINSLGLVDFLIEYTNYTFIDNKNKQDRTLWVNSFFNRIRIKDF